MGVSTDGRAAQAQVALLQSERKGGLKKRGLLESIQSNEWSGPGQISHIARC